jgi:hypothetical protein
MLNTFDLTQLPRDASMSKLFGKLSSAVNLTWLIVPPASSSSIHLCCPPLNRCSDLPSTTHLDLLPLFVLWKRSWY